MLGSSVVVEREKSNIGASERSNNGARYSVSYSNSDLDPGSSPDLELCFVSNLVPALGSRSVV